MMSNRKNQTVSGEIWPVGQTVIRYGRPLATALALGGSLLFLLSVLLLHPWVALAQVDPPGPVEIDFQSASIRVAEDVGTVNMTILLSRAATETVSVDYRTLQAAAQPGSDYVEKSGTLSFEPGEVAKSVTVEIIDDAISEPRENFAIFLSNGVNGTIVRTFGYIEISDNDGEPKLSFGLNGYAVYEESETVDLTVQLSNASENNVLVDFATIPNSAFATDDFLPVTGTLTFTPGQTVETVTLSVVNDGLEEPVESFDLQLSNPRNGVIEAGAGLVEISIGDGAAPQLVLADLSLEEGDSGQTDGVLQLNLTTPALMPVRVKLQSVDGTATAGAQSDPEADYASYNQQVMIPAGKGLGEVPLAIYGDTQDEAADETFEIMVMEISGATVGTITTATVTILNDDADSGSSVRPQGYLPLVRNK